MVQVDGVRPVGSEDFYANWVDTVVIPDSHTALNTVMAVVVKDGGAILLFPLHYLSSMEHD